MSNARSRLIVDRQLQQPFEFAPVGQPSQRVVRGLMLELCGKCPLLGDITHYEDNTRNLVMRIADRSSAFLYRRQSAVAPLQQRTRGRTATLFTGQDVLEFSGEGVSIRFRENVQYRRQGLAHGLGR